MKKNITRLTDFFLLIPRSYRFLVNNSIIGNNELNAARNNARKNTMDISEPPGIVENNIGIIVKVSAWFPLCKYDSASVSVGVKANTAGKMAIPANNEAVLFPNAPTKVFSVTSSLFLE